MIFMPIRHIWGQHILVLYSYVLGWHILAACHVLGQYFLVCHSYKSPLVFAVLRVEPSFLPLLPQEYVFLEHVHLIFFCLPGLDIVGGL